MRSNTKTHYGSIAKSLHWITVALIFTLIPLGIIANGLPFDTSEELARKAWLFSLHKTLGVTLFAVALLRITWSMVNPHPALLNADRPLEAGLARMVHVLLYGSLIAVPLSGWVHHAATTGFAPIWWPFGQTLPFVPTSEPLAQTAAGLHIVFERVLVIALLLHIAGALKHHFVDRDATLKRMLPGTPALPALPDLADRQPGRTLPVIGALAAWALAIGTGSALGLYAKPVERPDAVALDAAPSEWQVTDGTLALEVRQLGSTVSGQFQDWNAAISFDPEVAQGRAGDVSVQVSIPSLTLGSVTSQALGPDFLAAEAHPVATYSGDILRDADGYRIDGTLALKDTEMPLVLPFTLELVDGVARARASTNVDRRDFGIGMGQSDEATLGFGVDLRIELSATRGAQG